MPQEPLSNIDTAWLRLEDRSHPMMITAAITFGAPLDAERLKATFGDRLLCYRRFRQRVVQPDTVLRWHSELFRWGSLRKELPIAGTTRYGNL